MSEMMLQAARHYLARGWNVIPMLPNGKQPAVRWKRFQTSRPRDATLRNWFGSNSEYGLAVIFGEISGNLGSRDFDDATAYVTWAKRFPKIAETLPTVKTHRGAHVYFRTDPQAVADYRRSIGKPSGTGAIHLIRGELRLGIGCYSLVPPSPHPKGGVYRWVIPLGETLPLVTDFVAAGLVPNSCHREHRAHTGRMRNPEAMRGSGLVPLSACIQNLLTNINQRMASKEASKESEVVVAREAGESAVPEDVLKAIEETLPTGPGQRNRHVFEFARALKALPGYRDADVKALDREIRAWHERAKPFIETQPFEETLIDFRKGWDKVRFPRGEEPMAILVAQAFAADVPEVAAKYESLSVRRLVALCRELQRAAGDGPFYLSCHTAGRLLGSDHKSANRWLFLLADDGILQTVEKGSNRTRKATRYRYLPPL